MLRRAAVLTAATLVAGGLCLFTEGLSSPARAAIPSAPCQPDGATSADQATAVALRPSMTGKRLGRSVTGYSISCARAIVANVQARRLDERAAVIAVTVAIAESTLHNYTVAVDHDSLGLFQQRPSMGWGQAGQLTDPRYATDAFLNAMIRKHTGDGWMGGDIGQICQRVQGSAFPEAYAPEVHDAALIVTRLWPRAAGTAAGKPATTPSGPFRGELMADATGWGMTDDRHDISAADWNGDRRPDLVVVQHSGTTTGRAELYILDGTPAVPNVASSFQRLLLRTTTPLGLSAGRQTFAMADWNGDGRLDLVAIQQSGTASGRTELRILDGATSFQTFLLQTATALGPTDARHEMSVADTNGDNVPDLIVAYKSDTASGKTEVQVLDGASVFQREVLHAVTSLGPTDARHELSFADWNGDGRLDLVDVQKAGAASRRIEIRVLDGAAGFRRDLQKTVTALGQTDGRRDLSIADWNGDGHLDLIVVQKWATASGRTEAQVLSGA